MATKAVEFEAWTVVQTDGQIPVRIFCNGTNLYPFHLGANELARRIRDDYGLTVGTVRVRVTVQPIEGEE